MSHCTVGLLFHTGDPLRMIINLLSPFPIESQLIVTYSVVLKYEVSQCVLSFLWHLMLLVWPFSKDRFLKKHPPPLIFVIFWFWNTKFFFGWETFLAFFPIFWFRYLFKGSYNQISFLIFIFKHAKHDFDFSSNLFFSVILHVTNFGHCSEKAQLKPHYNP